MARRTPSAQCGRAEASARLKQALAFAAVADLVLGDESDLATPGVATALAVLAGIAASDAACCAALGERARGQSHAQAIALLTTVQGNGPRMARHLSALLAAKDESHYGVHLVAEKNAHKLVAQAQALVALAQGVVQR